MKKEMNSSQSDVCCRKSTCWTITLIIFILWAIIQIVTINLRLSVLEKRITRIGYPQYDNHYTTPDPSYYEKYEVNENL